MSTTGRTRSKYQYNGKVIIDGITYSDGKNPVTIDGLVADQYGMVANSSLGNPLLSSMTDVRSSQEDYVPWKMNACTKSSYSTLPRGVYLRYYHPIMPSKWYDCWNPICWAPYCRTIFRPELPSTASLVSETLSDVSGTLPDDQRVNIMENLLDMHDMKGLVSSLTGLFMAAGKMFGGIFSYSLSQLKHNAIRDNRGAKKGAKAAAVGASEAWLSYWLVVKPLISDVRNLWNMANNIQARLNELSYRNSVEYFSIKKKSTSVLNSTSSNLAGGTSFSATRTIGYTSNWSGKYDISDASATILALQAIGFATPMSTAWNCVPLSFVVDYLFDINSKLESADKIITESAMKLQIGYATPLSACKTDSIQVTHDNYVYLPGTGVKHNVGQTWVREFSRTLLPITTFTSESALNKAGLTAKRLTTVGALAVCKKLR